MTDTPNQIKVGTRTFTQRCTIEGCDRPHSARGMCMAHYQQWRRTGQRPKGPVSQMRMCTLSGCNQPHYAHGWCKLHYDRVRATGEPGPAQSSWQADPVKRIMARLEGTDTNGHWEWPGAMSGGSDPIPNIAIAGRKISVRKILAAWVEGVEVKAVSRVLRNCDNRRCCNPDHMTIYLRSK